jgi:hypothetical protein
MEAFITGSRAYGNPTAGSDIDLVVRVSEATRYRLRQLAGCTKPDDPVHFGRLNLILVTDDATMAVWKLGTESLVIRGTKGATFNRDEAKSVLDSLRRLINQSDEGGDSGGGSMRESEPSSASGAFADNDNGDERNQ